jgi:hypothetical protein
LVTKKRFGGRGGSGATEVDEEDQEDEEEGLLLRRGQQGGERDGVGVVDEAVGAAGDGDWLQYLQIVTKIHWRKRATYELEEKLIDGASADATDTVSEVVLEPVVARAEAKGDLAYDLQKVKRGVWFKRDYTCKRKKGTAKPT